MENKNSISNTNRIGFIILGILALVVIGFVTKAVIDTKRREAAAVELAAQPFGPIDNKSESAVPVADDPEVERVRREQTEVIKQFQATLKSEATPPTP